MHACRRLLPQRTGLQYESRRAAIRKLTELIKSRLKSLPLPKKGTRYSYAEIASFYGVPSQITTQLSKEAWIVGLIEPVVIKT